MIIYSSREGTGLLNKIINKLPVELHLPGYQYCGPGTRLRERLARGDPGINPLDAACKEHDIAYSQNRENVQARNIADRILADKAWHRVLSKDAEFGEKAAAYAITNVMKLKSKFGMGVRNSQKRKRKSRTSLRSIIKTASKFAGSGKKTFSSIRSALEAAKAAVRKAGGKDMITMPRSLQVPTKVGGFLPFLIPLFAGLSATGALAGGAAGIAKAVNDAKAAQRQLDETQRHNKAMETLAIGKGLSLQPTKKGMGIYLRPYGKGLKKKDAQSKVA